MSKIKVVSKLMVLVFAVCFFSGCATQQVAQSSSSHKGSYIRKPKAEYKKEVTREFVYMEDANYGDIIPYNVRDYIIKGIVFVESKVTIDVNGEKNGSEITNFMLMKEAKKLGADDVINIKIDKKEEHKVVDNYDSDAEFINREYKKTVYIYQATALAIKYTNAIYGSKVSVDNKTSITTKDGSNNKTEKTKNK